MWFPWSQKHLKSFLLLFWGSVQMDRGAIAAKSNLVSATRARFKLNVDALYDLNVLIITVRI
jgi:hypothetical protein